MGESVTEGTVLEWHIAGGRIRRRGRDRRRGLDRQDRRRGPGARQRRLTKILVAPDDMVEIGQALAELDPSGEPSGTAPTPSTARRTRAGARARSGRTAKATRTSATSTPRRNAPQPGETDGRRLRADGRRRDRRQSRCPRWASRSPRARSSSGTWPRATRSRRARPRRGLDRQGRRRGPRPGRAARSRSSWSTPDDTVQVGQALAEMTAGAGAAAAAARGRPAEATPPRAAAPPADGGNGARASPVARRIAAAKGVDLGAVAGLGPGRQGDQGRRPRGRQRRRRRGGRCGRRSPPARPSPCAARPRCSPRR